MVENSSSVKSCGNPQKLFKNKIQFNFALQLLTCDKRRNKQKIENDDINRWFSIKFSGMKEQKKNLIPLLYIESIIMK